MYDALDADGRVLFEIIGIGWSVFERPMSESSDYQLRGGVVVDMHTDDDEQRVFTVVDSPGGRIRFFDLRQDQIDPHAASMPNSAVVRARARQMQTEAGRRRGAADGFDLKLARYALVLLEQIG